MTRRPRRRVMIVVPFFPKRKHGNPEAIGRGITRKETLRSPHVKTIVEAFEQVAENRPIFQLFPLPRSPLLRRCMLQFLEILIEFFLFFCRWKLSVAFHKLLEASAGDQNHSGDVDFFRFQLSHRVQAPILIALHVGVAVKRF